MPWQPLKSPEDRPRATRLRTAISHATLIFVGMLMLFAGYKCISVGKRVYEEQRLIRMALPANSTQRTSSAHIALFVGGTGLCVLGTLTILVTFVPVSWLEYLRPRAPVTGDRDISTPDNDGGI